MSGAWPKISIITPSYNQGKFLEETINSIISQDYPNLEYIIIDGASTDNSPEIIKRYGDSLAFWVSEPDKGQTDALNKGFKRATGDIVTWINSDDTLEPGVLKQIAERFQQLPASMGLVYGKTEVFGEETTTHIEFEYGNACPERFIASMGFSQPASFFRKRFLDQVGLADETLRYGMDYYLFSRLALVSDFQSIDLLISRYRIHPQSKTSSGQTGFRKDWDRVFATACAILQMPKLLERAKKYLPEADLLPLSNTDLQPAPALVARLNPELLLFYFLSDHLLYRYWNGDSDGARQLYKSMKPDFPADWFTHDTRVAAMISKLKLPASLLNLAKTVKSWVKK